MKEILIASKNINKIKEISSILNPIGITCKSILDYNIDDIIEDGVTFYDNALIKAKSIINADIPVLGEDSGLCVKHLNGKPGVRSKRYAHENATSDENNAKMLFELDGVKDRDAYFITSIVLYFKGKHISFEGILNGEISKVKSGDKGFGYDPIFLYDGRSLASLNIDEKISISHRGRALKKMIEFFDNDFSTFELKWKEI